MSEVNIDRITIDIESNAQNAVAPIESLADAVARLKTSVSGMSGLDKLARDLKSLSEIKTVPKVLSDTTKQIERIGKSSAESSPKLTNFLRAGLSLYAIRRVGRVIGEFIDKSIKYVENLNLFTVSMGNASEKASEFVDNFSTVLGIDPSNLMRYMGFFNQLASGLGVASEKSYIMSKNLTQLGYDMASFLNIPIEEAMNKLESGISGISKPLRSVGIATSEAALQAKLLSLGYQMSVRDLSEASKAQLRYIQILDSTVNMQGDLARTLITPANALRILKENFDITARSIGNMFIPALSAIIPYAIAALQVVADLANYLANLFGFKLPVIDYSGLSGGLEDVEDGAESAAKAINKLNAPFDELHDISKSTASALGGGIDIDFDLDTKQYDALIGAIGNRIEEIKEKMLDFLKALQADPVQVLSDAFWNLGKSVANLLIPDNLPVTIASLANSLLIYGITGNPLLAVAVGILSEMILPLLGKTQQMDILAFSIETLTGALLLSTGLGLPLPLSIALSGLASSGLVTLLGKETAIYLLGGAITGIGTAMLTYKGTANLPLALALGVLSGYLVPMIDNLTEYDLLVPVLGGLAVGVFAFTKTGDLSTSLLAGISTMLTLFVSLNDVSPELEVALRVLAGAISVFAIAVGIDIAVATGGMSVLIGGIVTLVANIGTFAMSLGKEAIPEIKRFSDSISQSTKTALNPFMDTFDKITLSIMKLKSSGIPITKDFAKTITSEFKSMADTVIEQTERMKNEALANLRSLYGLDAEEYETAYERIKKVYDSKYEEINRLKEAQLEYNIEAGILYGNDTSAYAEAVASFKSESDAKIAALGYTEESLRIAFEKEVESLQTLAPEYASMREKTLKEFDAQKEGIELKLGEVNSILREKLESGGKITSEEWSKITEIQNSYLNEGIDLLSANKEEAYEIRLSMSDNATNLAKRQAIDVANSFKEERDDGIAKANELYSERERIIKLFSDENSELSRHNVDMQIIQAQRERDETIRALEENYEGQKKALNDFAPGFQNAWNEHTGNIKTEYETMIGASDSWQFAMAKDGENLKESLGQTFGGIKSILGGFGDFLAGGFTGNWERAWKGIKNIGVGAINTLIGAFNFLLQGINALLLPIFAPVNAIIKAVNDATGSSIPTIKLTIPLVETIPYFAQGGIVPRSADLFFANENGVPELVGSYGNRAAVANSGQITDGIAQGVAYGMENANAPMVSLLQRAVGLLQEVADKPLLDDVTIANANTTGTSKLGVRITKNPAFSY